MQSGRGRSFYDELRDRQNDRDVEDRTGLLDEENLNQHFHEYDFDHAEGLTADDSRITLNHVRQVPRRSLRSAGIHWRTQDDDVDNDVPASLLVEPHGEHNRVPIPDHSGAYPPRPIPGPSADNAQVRWDTTQRQQNLYREDTLVGSKANRAPGTFPAGLLSGSSKKKAEWRWANVSNLDTFTKDIYDYYRGHGLWCILLERALHLM